MSNAATKRPKPLVLLVLDGWGIAPEDQGNAIATAKTPAMDTLTATYPSMPLKASGEAVGLGWGSMGNSEVGHLTIGAGRVYYQSLPRIDHEIEQGTFETNAAFLKAVKHAHSSGGTVHLCGLVSNGGVHAHVNHLYALLDLMKANDVENVAVHAILDGRDTLYNAGYGFIESLLGRMKETGVGELASLSGRFYAMDRDNKWDRTEKAYNAMVHGTGEVAEDPLEAIKASYAKEVYDEQLVPTVVARDGKPVAVVKEGDAVIFFNFRPDRTRQLTRALVLPTFDAFAREPLHNVLTVTMMEYESGLPVEVAFPPEVVTKGLAEVISNTGLKQLHVAETEKYAHVTFFFNGTRETPFPGEERVMVLSPKVASYDETPSMSAEAVCDEVVKAVRGEAFDVIVANFANPDMVAHTGNLEATKAACEVTDACIGRIVEATLAKNGVCVITADHGNAEEMSNLTTAQMDKEHSTNPVPLIIAGNAYAGQPSLVGEVPNHDLSLVSPVGVLADVAPTILHILGIPQPPHMTGQTLIV